MDKFRELYSAFRFLTVLFAVLAAAGFWIGVTGYDGSDSSPGMIIVGVVNAIMFGVSLGVALGARERMKAPVVEIADGKDAA